MLEGKNKGQRKRGIKEVGREGDTRRGSRFRRTFWLSITTVSHPIWGRGRYSTLYRLTARHTNWMVVGAGTLYRLTAKTTGWWSGQVHCTVKQQNNWMVFGAGRMLYEGRIDRRMLYEGGIDGGMKIY